MRTLSGKAFARLLERHGWRLARVSGSHHIYVRDGDVARLSVPVHGSTDLKPGLQRHLMKLAGVTDADIGRA